MLLPTPCFITGMVCSVRLGVSIICKTKLVTKKVNFGLIWSNHLLPCLLPTMGLKAHSQKNLLIWLSMTMTIFLTHLNRGQIYTANNCPIQKVSKLRCGLLHFLQIFQWALNQLSDWFAQPVSIVLRLAIFTIGSWLLSVAAKIIEELTTTDVGSHCEHLIWMSTIDRNRL